VKLQHLGHNIYHVSDLIQYELSSTLFRLQEFYESPSRQLRGKYFTLEEALDCAARRQKDSYSDDYTFGWFDATAGCNVPGYVVRRFYKKFRYDLLKKEKRLFDMLKSVVRSDDKFYLIGTYDKESLKHEVAHALYYLVPEYKKEMNALTRKLPYKKAFKKRLIHYDYTNNDTILKDEIQAYMTETKPGLIVQVGFKKSWIFPTTFRETLDKYIKELEIKTDVNIT